MVCPKRERDFAAVVEVMFENAPDELLAGVAHRLLVLNFPRVAQRAANP